MTQRPVEHRIDQYCDACREVDKHPKHHFYDPAAQQSLSLHFHCCAARGCTVCREVLANAPAEAQHGDALVAHLVKDM